LAGICHGLTVVQGLELGELIRVLLEEIAELPDHPGALAWRDARPGPAFERTPRRRNGEIDIRLIPGRNLGDDLLGRRILDREGLAASRIDPFPVDHELELLREKGRGG
jgi:hypothetical protein